MIKLFLKKNWPSLVITLACAILTGLSKLEIDISWIKDINTWANAFILELYLFQLMSAITIKIKNQYWQSLISLMVSLFLGETIRYNFNLVDFSFMNLLGIFLFSLLTLMVTYQSFSFGINKGIKEIEQQKNILHSKITEMSNEDTKNFLKEINRSINFIKKHPFAASIIKDSNLQELESFRSEVKEIKNTTNKVDSN